MIWYHKSSIFVSLVIVAIELNIGESVRTCCPEDMKLNIIEGGLFSSDQYSCVKLPESNLTVIQEEVIEGTLIDISVSDSIPKCKGAKLKKLGDNSFRLSREGCISRHEGDFYAIDCPEGGKSVEADFVTKCCPYGSSYDFLSKSCVEDDKVWRQILASFRQRVVLKAATLECGSDKVLVEYYSSDHNLNFRGSDLFVDGQKFPTGSYCVDGGLDAEDYLKPKLIVRVCQRAEICDVIPCVRKCCKDMEKIYQTEEGAPGCKKHFSSLPVNFHHYELYGNGTFNVTPVVPKVYGIVHELKCQKYPLDPTYELDEHYINHKNGSLYLVHDDVYYTKDSFCLDFGVTSEAEIATFLCFDEPETKRYVFISIGLMVSCCFLALTFLVYACIPKLLNLPGKILMCQVTSMFIAYLLLSLLQFNNLLVTYCVQSAFVLYFSFLSTFSWLNVMCFDIWWTFGSIERAQGIRKSHQIRRFLLYSLYGWGYPLAWTMITFIIDNFKLVHEAFLPMIGENRCWFTRGARAPAHFVFFLLPIGILVFANLILFILTMKYCNKVKSEISRMQSTNNDKVSMKKRFQLDKARFAMNTKLFIVMGISWILEIVSAVFATSEYIFYISDAANISQGILVFFIFVFKKNVLDEIRRRLGLLPKRYRYGTTVVGTNTTMATSLTDLRLSNVKSIGSCQSLLQPPLSPRNMKRSSPPL